MSPAILKRFNDLAEWVSFARYGKGFELQKLESQPSGKWETRLTQDLPLNPLHGGHVGLLCTAELRNGVFGEDDRRHIAFWRSVKFVDHYPDVCIRPLTYSKQQG